MIPLSRKFYKSIEQHRKSIDRAKVILQPPFTTLSFIVHKKSGVVEAIQSSPLSISANYKFQYMVKTFTDIPPYMYDIVANYKHTFGRSQLIWDEEKQLLDVYFLNIKVDGYDNYLKDINAYESFDNNVFNISFNVTNLKGDIVDISKFSEVSVKNMGDKDKTNGMLVNGTNDRYTYLVPQQDHSFKVVVNDFNEENIFRVKIKNSIIQKLWLTDYIALICRK